MGYDPGVSSDLRCLCSLFPVASVSTSGEYCNGSALGVHSRNQVPDLVAYPPTVSPFFPSTPCERLDILIACLDEIFHALQCQLMRDAS